MTFFNFLQSMINGDPEPLVIAITLLLVMIFFLLLSFPMVLSLVIATIVGFLHFSDLQLQVIIQQMLTGITPNVLVAVPMFIFAADIMTRGHTANRLLDLIDAFVGHYRGGLPITTCLACTMFGSVSGSTQATVVSVGSIMRPRLLKAGYKDSFALALIINASDIAWLIPPSIGLILFGVVSNTNIAELFIAGIVPGLVLSAIFCLYCYIYSCYHNKTIELVQKRSWGDRIITTKKALLSLGFPLLIVGGIYSGAFTPTEAASFSVLYAITLEMFIYKTLKISDIFDSALSTGIITAVVFILVGAGQAFSWYISFEQIPSSIFTAMNLEERGYEYILFIISLAFFIGCMFVDSIVVLLILAPVFLPAIEASGVDPVLAGVIITLQMAIGSATPPFGCDIFTAIAVFKRPYLEVVRGIFPFFLLLVTMTLLLIFFPEISLWLRDVAFNK